MTDDLTQLSFVLAFSLGWLLVLEVAHHILRRVGRRVVFAAELTRRAHRPAQVLVALCGVIVGMHLFVAPDTWRDLLLRGFDFVLIGVGAWFFTALLFAAEEAALSRFRTDVEDNRRARRVHTQVRLIRRVTAAVVTVVALGTMLMTIPSARTIGTSLLATFGVVGVVAALAAQSVMGNVLAGLQIAFGGSLRLGDVVVVEEEWGRIEEITLTHVVVQIWDERCLILPTSYFTTKPFQNWTRTEAAVIGSVELDVDWVVPVDRMRAHLRNVLSDSDSWDGRLSVLQVTDAVGGVVRVRALVSAHDAPTLWDLRCLVREQLVGWLREHHDDALPRARTNLIADGLAGANGWDAQVFGGSAAGQRRGLAFAGPREQVDQDEAVVSAGR